MRIFFEGSKKQFFLILIVATVVLNACNSSDKTLAEVIPPPPASQTNSSDWIRLFDGKTFAGWHTYGLTSVGDAWKVEDSAIHLTSSIKNGWQTANGGDLVTDEEYGDFDLSLEYKISPGGNSGIFFYVRENKDKFANPNQSGLEMQINDDANNKNGNIEKQRNGDLVGLVTSSATQVTKPAGEWNQVEIRSDRGKLYFFMNGKNVLSTTLWGDSWEDLIEKSKFKNISDYGTYRKGKIVLQDHGADVWFRNIRIKKL